MHVGKEDADDGQAHRLIIIAISQIFYQPEFNPSFLFGKNPQLYLVLVGKRVQPTTREAIKK